MDSRIYLSLVCFAVATILFTPRLEESLYQAVSFLFFFLRRWALFNTLITPSCLTRTL